MSLKANLIGNGYLAPPSGYPVTLHTGRQTMIDGFIPKHVKTITAEVYAETGTADFHLAVYSAPSSSGGSDGALVVTYDDQDTDRIVKTYQTDALAVGLTTQTLTLTVPDDRAQAPYVVRLWVDNITGRTADETDRDADSSTDDEALLEGSVVVESIKVA